MFSIEEKVFFKDNWKGEQINLSGYFNLNQMPQESLDRLAVS